MPSRSLSLHEPLSGISTFCWPENTSPLIPADRSWLRYLPVGQETHPLLPADRSWLCYLPVGQETHPLCYLQIEVGCVTFLLARKHIPSATCGQKLAVLPSCWPGNTSPLLPADRSWLCYLPVGQETHPLCYLQIEVGCVTFLLARKHIPSATCRQKLAVLPSCWPGNTSPLLPADRSWLCYLPVGQETHPLLPADRSWLCYLPVGQETHPLCYLQIEVGCVTFLLARKHIPSATCGQKLAVLPSCWPGNTSPLLPADRSWLRYLPVGQETHPLCYLQTEVGCLTFLLARKHIPSATCRQKLAVLPFCWPGNTSPLLPADRSWLSYLSVGQETHPLCYLQTEVGCVTFLLARKHIPSATCRQKLAVLPSCLPGNTSPLLPADRSWLCYLPVGQETHPLLPADRSWLCYLPVGQETHPLCYLQIEVGCVTFLLARKHIPSATCGQKLAVLPSCWPGNTSPLLPADRSWLRYLPVGQKTHPLLPADRSWLSFLSVGQETHPLCYLQTEVGCVTFLLTRKHIPSATCRQKLAALPFCWPGNTSPLLPADRSWLSYFSVGQETHPLCYLRTEVGCVTFLLARKHIPSATCGQKLAALPSCWPGNTSPATCGQKLAVFPFCWPGNTSPLLPADRSWLCYLPVDQETHPLCYLRTEVGCLTFLLARKHIPSATAGQKLAALPSCWPGNTFPATCRQKLAVLPFCWPGNTSPLLPADRSWLSYLPVGQETHPSATCRQKLAQGGHILAKMKFPCDIG